MGIITGIRKRGGLLIVLIGLAVAGFIVMDVVQNRNMSGSVTNVGQVGNHTLDFNEMRQMEEVLYQGSDADEYSKREYIWNYFVENAVVQESAKGAGVTVGRLELIDMQFGANPAKLMVERYGNPQTGQLDMAQLQNVRDKIKAGTLEPQMVAFWGIQEKELIKNRLGEKLASLFNKAIYTPTWQAEAVIADQTVPVNTLYVKVPTSYVADTEVKLTDADYQKYIDDHKGAYTNKTETRVISFVNIAVLTSKNDTLAAEQSIKEKLEDFRTAPKDSVFIAANSGTISDVYTKTEQLDPIVKTKVGSMNVGDVYGPYIDGTTVKAVKLLGKSAVPDSVDSRHILISAQNPQEFEVANRRIDSIENVIKTGKGKFADLARVLSTDKSSGANGGNLGYSWQGRMVKPFNDVLFINSKVGDIKKVQTQFGVHLIEILNKKTVGDANGYKLAFISTELVPSEATQNAMQAQVETLMAGITTLEQLDAKIKTVPGLQIVSSFAVDESDFALQGIPPGPGSRDIIKWAFDPKTKVGSISETAFPIQQNGRYYVEQFVIPGLKAINTKGLNTIAALKEELTPKVMAEKKVDILAAKAKNTKSLEAFAQEFSVKVDTAKSVVFGGSSPGIGNEPRVIAAVYVTPINSVSPIIKGYNGLFLVKPYEKVTSGPKPPIENAKKFYANSIRQQMSGRLLEALKKKADIEDNRGQLF